MNKYIFLMKYEFKTILRDPISLYMCFFSVLILFASSFLFPKIINSVDPANKDAKQAIVLLLLVIILAMGSYFIAAMGTFSLIENKDEHTINTIAVTPISISGYIRFKMTYLYIMSILSSVLIIWGTKLLAGHKYVIGNVRLLDNLQVSEVLAFAIVSSLFIPALALFQGALAKNKVEGFAFIKSTGIVALVPALIVLKGFSGWLQYILGIFPNFWAVKGIMLKLLPMDNAANMSYPMYLTAGAVYNALILILAYRLFVKKVQY